jgi:hypothetical protein
MESAAKCPERALLYGFPNLPHELREIPEIMNRVQPRAEHFLRDEQMVQIGA